MGEDPAWAVWSGHRPGGRLVTPDELYARPPRIHTDGHGRAHGRWALSRESLSLIERLARPGQATLETGAGLSTALLALIGTDHTAVTPEVAEVRRLKTYCARHAI